MGTPASLDTTNKDATIYEKNETPTIAKTVLKEGATAGTDNSVAYLTTTEGDVAVWVENTDCRLQGLCAVQEHH